MKRNGTNVTVNVSTRKRQSRLLGFGLSWSWLAVLILLTLIFFAKKARARMEIGDVLPYFLFVLIGIAPLFCVMIGCFHAMSRERRSALVNNRPKLAFWSILLGLGCQPILVLVVALGIWFGVFGQRIDDNVSAILPINGAISIVVLVFLVKLFVGDKSGTDREPDQSMPQYDVFLSYSHEDHTTADQLSQTITKHGGEVFLADRSLSPGDVLTTEIRQALTDSRELWIVATRSSLESTWVLSEVGAAWGLRKRVVPILCEVSLAELPDILRNLRCVDLKNCDAFVSKAFSGS